MLPGRYVDPADDYEAAAEFCAKTYGRPIEPQLVRALLSAPEHVFESIECNPQDWRQRVRDYCYGIAMGADQ